MAKSTTTNPSPALAEVLVPHLAGYRSFFQGPSYDELYKWQIAKTVQDNWDLGVQDLAAMIDRSFAHAHQNLWAGAHYFPKAMLMEWATEDAEGARGALRQLLEGQAPLGERMRAFEQAAKAFCEQYKPGKNMYQGMRASALWLGMVLPTQHYLYKASMVKGFIKATDHAPLEKPGDKYTVIDSYYALCEEVRQVLLAHPEIIEAHRAIRDASCHGDPEHHLLVQDFIYYVAEHQQNEEPEESEQEEDFIRTLRSFAPEKQRALLNDLGELLQELGVEHGDERVVFHVVPGVPRLGLSIGQAYCMQLGNSERGPVHGFALEEEGRYTDVEYKEAFSGPYQRMYAYTAIHERVRDHWPDIQAFCAKELERTSGSGQHRFNNPYFERAVFDETYRAEVLSAAISVAPVRLVMVNLTWNSKDWKEPTQDVSNHDYVKEGGVPMESWNFDLENPRNPEGKVLGFVQHTSAPKLEGNNNLVIFHSAGKVIGFYGKGEFLKDKPTAADGNLYNVIGDRALSVVLTNKLGDIKQKGYLEKKKRMGQNGFIYLEQKATALKMLDEALALNPAQAETLKAIRSWVQGGVSRTGPAYWIFQANPDRYDTVGAIRSGVLRTWHVSAYKDRIAPGDKVILWQTGKDAGCLALATVTTAVQEQEPNADELAYYADPTLASNGERVGIRIDHDLSKDPVPWSRLRELPAMQGFKAGNQGTTFQATKAQYDTIRTHMSNEASMHELNTILYGPPGTGKTYHAVSHAVAIVDGKPVKEVMAMDREQVRQRFEELSKARVIRSVTFHQSFSYEDFVEGIKPKTIGGEEEDEPTLVTYEVVDGIFKEMCMSARTVEDRGTGPKLDSELLEKANFYKVSLGQFSSSADDAIYQYCMDNGVIAVGYGGNVDVSAARNEEEIRRILKDAGHEQEESGRYTITVLRTMHLDMKEGDIVLVSAGNSSVRAIGRVSGPYFMDTNAPIRFKQFRKVEWLHTDLEVPVEDIYPKSFSMGTLYSLDRQSMKLDYFRPKAGVADKGNGNYVLIIDEINRGNVASIFGELITLIEKDKREGMPETVKVRLPYSPKEFSVPKNLYLLGTMNTADRSVEALDTALRRRFSFIEMPSDPKVIDNKHVTGVDLVALLQQINQRVERLMDKDHHIGHSYFMGLKDLNDLKRVFKNKVIPLLEEYFHGDAYKVGAILGPDFVEKEDGKIKFAKEFDQLDEYEVKDIYRVKDVDKIQDAEVFKRIYAAG